jgi:DNA helicase-2/ATP-dependent DNA helicase PcrA
VINPVDDISCLRIINYPPRAIGKDLTDNIQAVSRIKDCTMMQATEMVAQEPELSSRRKNSLNLFQNLIAHFRDFLKKNPFPMLADAKRENVRNLLEEIDRYAETTPDASLNGFLEEVALITDVDDLTDEEEKINLMTMHSSKGLEFSVVLIGGVEESILPLKPRDGEAEDTQEERRLFYVGLTRAKERVILGCASSRMRWGQLQWNDPSRFLREIPTKLLAGNTYLLQSRSRTSYISSPQSTPVMSAQRSTPQTSKAGGNLDPDDMTRGLLVKHSKFGLGIITEFTNLGLDSRIQVDFDDVGKKLLILKYARLEIVR